jgi:formylglycine-generating enzyme required for sulfatase activity
LIPLLLSIAMAPQEPYVEKLPGAAAEFKMISVAAGKVEIGGKTVEVKPFFMAATETTWEVFDGYLLSGEPSKPYDQTKFAPDAIARPSRSYHLPDLGWGHKGYPVICVSSETAEMFCRWLSSVTKKKYRLPTEAEWELAAREGKTGEWKLSEAELAKREWYSENNFTTTSPVAKREPNAFGIYDMLGNVGEWAVDMSGKPVLCGGDFNSTPAQATPKTRRYYHPDWQQTDPQLPKSRWWLSDGYFAGFRVVCEP